jgi:hypothetical protein
MQLYPVFSYDLKQIYILLLDYPAIVFKQYANSTSPEPYI